MSNFKKYGPIVVIIMSMILNGIFYGRLKESNQKLQETNQLVSLQVERGIRQSMGYIAELKETQSQQTMQNLQRTLQDLTVAFKHWHNLNETERRQNLPMEKGLLGIESLRNAIIHHLNNQYLTNNHQLSEYDKEFLDKAQEGLNQLLKVYFNIKDRVPALMNAKESDGGLIQVASNIEEFTRLYRHSQIPNQHPSYIPYFEAIGKAEDQYPFLENYSREEGQELAQIRDGVHYYQLNYFQGKTLAYVVWVDAIDGSIRNYEMRLPASGKKNLDDVAATKVAQKYIEERYDGQVVAEMFRMKTEGDSPYTIYAFRFTPIINDMKMISNAYIVNVASSTGDVIKYSNDFNKGKAPSYQRNFSIEEILELYREEYKNLEFYGESVVRSFQTYYQPRVALSFRTIQNEQQMLVFFDIETGRLIYQLYYIYQPIE